MLTTRAAAPRADNGAMSYVLQIWAFPMPQSIAQVDGILGELSRRPRKPNTQFVELARRLTARHPCITTLDEDDDNAVWTDGPMDGRTDEPCWGIGILSQHIDTVQPFVVETATSMGFVVYDDQAGECHLPGGMSLLADGRRIVGEHLGQPVPGELDLAAVQRTLQQALESAVAPNGFRFEATTGRFLREAGDWTQSLACRVLAPPAGAQGRAAEEWLCDVDLAWGHTKMARLWNELDRAAVLVGAGPAQRYGGSARTTFSRLGFWARRRWPVLATRRGDNTFVLRNPDELRQTAVALRQLAATEMVDMVRVIRSVEQLAFWCLGEDTQVWKPYPLLRSTPSGLEKTTLQRHLIDTEGCGGPAALLLLGGVGAYPDLQQLLARVTAQAQAEGSGAALRRVELAAQGLREAGLMPAA